VLAAREASARAAWAMTDDPSPVALAVGGRDGAKTVGMDLAGADALVVVGRCFRVEELWRRTLRLVPPGARLPKAVHYVQLK